MGLGSLWHWIILLIVVLLIFGTKKLRDLGSDLGGAIKGFKEGMREGDPPPAPQETTKVVESQPQAMPPKDQPIDVQVKEKS